MRAAAGGTDDILAQAVGEFIDRLKPELACAPEGRDVDDEILHRRLIVEARGGSRRRSCAPTTASVTANCSRSAAPSARSNPKCSTVRSSACAPPTS